MTANIKSRPDATLRGNYVLLTADALHLLLPQQEVGAAEYLEGSLQPGDEPGLLQLAGAEGARRYAALSTQMTLLPHCPSDRFMVAPIGDGTDGLLWCWNELQILIDVELQPRPLPAVLLAPDTPFDSYIEFEGKLAYLCTAHQLCAYALASRN